MMSVRFPSFCLCLCLSAKNHLFNKYRYQKMLVYKVVTFLKRIKMAPLKSYFKKKKTCHVTSSGSGKIWILVADWSRLESSEPIAGDVTRKIDPLYFKCQNHEEDCTNFCHLLRKDELYHYLQSCLKCQEFTTPYQNLC